MIPKPGSREKRPLGIPTVQDRVVQTALKMVIEPIFEKEFAPHSYGFRPGRGCKDNHYFRTLGLFSLEEAFKIELTNLHRGVKC